MHRSQLNVGLVLLGTIAAACAAHAAAATTALVHGDVVDVERRTVLRDSTVLIENDRIAAVGKAGSVDIPAAAQVIDVRGKWLLPGMVDAHIHLFQSGGLYTRPDSIDLRRFRPYEAEVSWVQANAGDLLARYLAAGITTVIDMGGPRANFAIRDRYNRETRSPTILLTGPLIVTATIPNFEIPDSPFMTPADPAAARVLVRQQLPYRPDHIKIIYIVRAGQSALDLLPIVAAAIDEAHKHRLRVAVHATTLETAKLSVEAGADVLVHTVSAEPVDAGFVALVERRRVPYISTLVVNFGYADAYERRYNRSARELALANPFALSTLSDLAHLPLNESDGRRRGPSTAESLARHKYRLGNLRKVANAGGIVAAGTDAGNIGTQHGSSFLYELLDLRNAGLSNWQILEAATLNGAKVAAQEQEFGSIAVGKRADLVILERDPTTDLQNLAFVHRVVNRGTVLEPASLIDASPPALAQRRLVAYNHRNIEAFLEIHSDEVQVYDFPDRLLYAGKQAMRSHYGQIFAANPELHCELVHRVVSGRIVIDQERITGRAGGPIEATAIYTITDGKISRVDFIK